MESVHDPIDIKKKQKTNQQCYHCQEMIINTYKNNKGHLFCCSGCKMVFDILSKNGLTYYYKIKKNEDVTGNSLKSINPKKKFDYLDDEDFLKEKTSIVHGHRIAQFYVEGVHCLACLWLLEKVPDLLEGVLVSRLDISKSVLKLTLKKDTKLSLVASEVLKLGYPPHIISNESDQEQLSKREEKSDLIKIGVAAFSSGNIMLYSISVYSGAEGYFGLSFSWASFILAIPVLLYSAIPFYKKTLLGIKNKTVNIDQPIALALILGSLFSTYNLTLNITETYFDSLTILVFLILLSRYFVKKTIQENTHSSSIRELFQEKKAHIFNKKDNLFLTRHSKYIKANDLIKVYPGEIFPADGQISKGKTYTANNLLTGESTPVKCSENSFVFSGTQNISNEIEVLVTSIGQDSRLGKILEKLELEKSNKTPFLTAIDKFSGTFLTFVLLLSTLIIFYFFLQGHTYEGIERALALIIVTCPCALGLAPPLALAKSLKLAKENKIILKSEDLLERIARSKNIYLDKTGTLTHGDLLLDQMTLSKKDDLKHMALFKSIILALETRSKHPIAKTIVKKLKEENISPAVIKGYKETYGVGVSGHFQNNFYEIKSSEETPLKGECQSDDSQKGHNLTSIGFYKNSTCLLTFTLKDYLRKESKNSVTLLKEQGLTPWLLSGDRKATVESISKEVGILAQHTFAQMGPEQKYDMIKKDPNSIMVGDGANDSLALQKASVGIAVKGAMELSLSAADIYLLKPGVSSLLSLIKLSNGTLSLIKRNLKFSFSYNLIGATLAIFGHISPLLAAILMPLSSVSVLLSTLFGNKTLNSLKVRQ